jgi:anti-sigma factor RsiW
VENRLIFDSHPSEDLLEEYVFNRLPEDQHAQFEEHLLVCPRCQASLASTQQYIQLMKRAAAESQRSNPKGASWRPPRTAVIGTLVGTFVGALVLIAAVAGGIPNPWRTAGESAPVELTALRGGTGPAMARARAGDSIRVVIDANDLDERHNLRIEVVDSNGKRVWSAAAADPAQGTRISTRIGASLGAGVYWIRLYSSQGELLREFGLRTE